MLSNFAFTLYEIFGYLLPGSVIFSGFVTLYWAFFNPYGSMRVESFDPKVATCVVSVAVFYMIGHASQAIGNMIFCRVEKKALEMNSNPNIRQPAWKAAALLLGIDEKNLNARAVYRVLDEYAVQNGIAGDRDMYIYREGFYRGTCIALFFAALCVSVRALIPGTNIVFELWTLYVTWFEFVLTIMIVLGMGVLFYMRYVRFVGYRVTRAALAAIVVLEKKTSDLGSNVESTSITEIPCKK